MNCVMNKFQQAEKRYRDTLKKEIRLNNKKPKKQNIKLKKK